MSVLEQVSRYIDNNVELIESSPYYNSKYSLILTNIKSMLQLKNKLTNKSKDKNYFRELWVTYSNNLGQPSLTTDQARNVKVRYDNLLEACTILMAHSISCFIGLNWLDSKLTDDDYSKKDIAKYLYWSIEQLYMGKEYGLGNKKSSERLCQQGYTGWSLNCIKDCDKRSNSLIEQLVDACGKIKEDEDRHVKIKQFLERKRYREWENWINLLEQVYEELSGKMGNIVAQLSFSFRNNDHNPLRIIYNIVEDDTESAFPGLLALNGEQWDLLGTSSSSDKVTLNALNELQTAQPVDKKINKKKRKKKRKDRKRLRKLDDDCESRSDDQPKRKKGSSTTNTTSDIFGSLSDSDDEKTSFESLNEKRRKITMSPAPRKPKVAIIPYGMNNYEYKGKVINVGHTCSYDTVMQGLFNILNEHDDLAPYIRQHKELNEAIDLIKEGKYNLARCKWMEYCDYRGITITKNKSNEQWHCNGLLDNAVHGAISVFQNWTTTEYLGCSNKDNCPKVKDGSCKSTTRNVNKSVYIPVPKNYMNNIQEHIEQYLSWEINCGNQLGSCPWKANSEGCEGEGGKVLSNFVKSFEH